MPDRQYYIDLAKSQGGTGNPFNPGYSKNSEYDSRAMVSGLYASLGMEAPSSMQLSSMGQPDAVVNQVMDGGEAAFNQLRDTLTQRKMFQDQQSRMYDNMQRNIDRLHEAASRINQPITKTILDTQGQDALDSVTGASKPAGTALVKTSASGADAPNTVKGGLRGFAGTSDFMSLLKEMMDKQKTLK